MLRRAANDTDAMIATGMAMSSGQGVATTMTARKRRGSPAAMPAAAANSKATGV